MRQVSGSSSLRSTFLLSPWLGAAPSTGRRGGRVKSGVHLEAVRRGAIGLGRGGFQDSSSLAQMTWVNGPRRSRRPTGRGESAAVELRQASRVERGRARAENTDAPVFLRPAPCPPVVLLWYRPAPPSTPAEKLLSADRSAASNTTTWWLMIIEVITALVAAAVRCRGHVAAWRQVRSWSAGQADPQDGAFLAEQTRDRLAPRLRCARRGATGSPTLLELPVCQIDCGLVSPLRTRCWPGESGGRRATQRCRSMRRRPGAAAHAKVFAAADLPCRYRHRVRPAAANPGSRQRACDWRRYRA